MNVTPTSRAFPPLSSGMSIRYDRPADAICDAITGYHVYTRTAPAPQIDWFLPGTANVRFQIDHGPLSVRIGRRGFDLGRVVLYGPTTRAMRVQSHGGTVIGFGISALGWARLGLPAAVTLCDRIVPLDDLLGAGFGERLHERLSAGELGSDVKPMLDAALAPLVAAPHRDEALIRGVNALAVADTSDARVDAVAVELGVSEHTLRRIATCYFGMTTKVLLARSRFLRSFLDVTENESDDYGRIGPAYHDVSHFLRDARRFLGMTPRQFHLLRTPFLDASLRVRPTVLGSVTQALHRF